MPSADLTSPLAVSRALNTLLERAYWIRTIQADQHYSRLQDDTDGATSAEHDLTVFIDFQGDVWMNRHGDLRFRTMAGGGSSLRVRNALMVLAEAIRRDNEERPQHARGVTASAQAKVLNEAKAREIYDGWKHLPGWVPWVEGGNSHKQDEARRIAAAGVAPAEGGKTE